MRKIAFAFVIILFYNLAANAQKAGQFTSITLEPTIAYIKYQGADCRMVRLMFKDGKAYDGSETVVSFNGLTEHVKIPANNAGLDVFELPLPGAPVKVTTQAIVKLEYNHQTYTARCLVGPARDNWTVYVLPHSHVDIGYTNVQAKVLKLHMNNIDEAIDLAKKTENYPVEARYKWTTEAIWVVDNYLKQADEAKKKRFWDAVKNGWISLDGAYGNTNTSMTDSYQLMQLFAKSQQLAREHGIEIHTMFQGDVPGASWGLAAQSEQTGIKYFLSGPNASDRIGFLAKWQDKPFYWVSPSGQQKLLFWQCQPYSIGYALKGSKIPNFFTVEDPKPYYTGHPSENFLNPHIFKYLGDLEQNGFPYNMTILTWAMSDNAPIDPELPDAVKAWNEHFSSPKLVITSVKQFFNDFESRYKDQIPKITGDYTEYWTDGVACAARETALSRETSDELKQANAIWAIRGRPAYPSTAFDDTWKNLLLYNEHTWGAYNSTSEPDNEKVKSEWAVKQGYVLHAKQQTDDLMKQATQTPNASSNSVTVYNTLSWARTDVVYVPANLSRAGDLVKDEAGNKIPSQRLSSGELAFVAGDIPQFGSKVYTINLGEAYLAGNAKVNDNDLSNGLYDIKLQKSTGDIERIDKIYNSKSTILVDSAGFNKYIYLPGDTLSNLQTSTDAHITVKENGPLVVSLLITSSAPGANSLTREVRLVSGIDNVEIINTIDKQAIRRKESVHFDFPFHVPGAQVRYSIPWGSMTAESDQLPYANRNWYTMQRWVDVSNDKYGITWSSPDAPLFEIGDITTAGLLGGLHNSPLWLDFTPQSDKIYSWVMNNLWHTNFRADQDGKATFHYFFSAHMGGYDSFDANKTGLENHQSLLVAAGKDDSKGLFFKFSQGRFYIESIKPANDGKGVVAVLVSTGPADATIAITPQNVAAVKVYESDLMEDRKRLLGTNFKIPAKSIMTIRIEK
jgi:alpha-mannosidase